MNGGFTGLDRVCAAMLLFAATPALAASGVPIPEPTDVTLIALALAGVIIGRRGGRRPPEE